MGLLLNYLDRRQRVRAQGEAYTLVGGGTQTDKGLLGGVLTNPYANREPPLSEVLAYSISSVTLGPLSKTDMSE
jgi:hypothetical protein